MAMAKVVSAHDGIVRVMVRRNYIPQGLWGINKDLKIGDTIEITRRANNPYVIRVTK